MFDDAFRRDGRDPIIACSSSPTGVDCSKYVITSGLSRMFYAVKPKRDR